MAVVWGLRLAIHIGARKRGSGEDFRYAAMRASDPDRFPVRSLFTVFLLQAFLIWAISFPVQIGQISPVPASLTPLDAIGFALWLAGIGIESLADYQLKQFLADPENRGKVMDRGLWRYSRHPNYFGDALAWWGIFTVSAATPNGWMTLFSPLLMTFFLMKVSGVPLLEESLARRRQGYREYMERTSAFFPLPPRRGDQAPQA
jgi:steroid 5-alpha reductase family enzyme